MSSHFISKARLITKTGNVRCNQDKWLIKWTLHRNLSSTKTGNLNNISIPGQGVGAGTTPGGQQITPQKKGKFSKLKIFHAKWSWKAGVGCTILSVLDWWLLAAGGWFSWTGLLMRWTPIGVGIFAVIEWHLHNRKLEKLGLPQTASHFQMHAYCTLPLRIVSRCWGWFADCTVPTSLRPYVYGLYANTFHVNMDEAANSDMKDYRSLSEFFARSLKDNVRIIDKYSPVVSPADGKVLHFGSALSSQIEQVKGITYQIDSFLGPDTWDCIKKKHYTSENIVQHKDCSLYQCVIYLAPGDYHRFHSPSDWEPKIRRHFHGELLSVSPKIAEWFPGLFCLNERAVYIGYWKYGFYSFTAVGATNVGSVQIYFDDELKTNKWLGLKAGKTNKANEYDEVIFPSNVKISKGQLVGQFNMGSTIVIIFEAPKDFEFSIKAGQKIKVGEPLGYSKEEKKLALAEGSP